MEDLGAVLLTYGPWGLLLAFVAFVITNIEKVEKTVGSVLGLFSWMGTGIRHRGIRAKVQGDINSFRRSVNKEVKGVAPHNMRLQFVKRMDRAELLADKSTIVVRIRDRKDDDKNAVHAMLAFCPIGFIPQARPHLGGILNLAVDITMTRKLLGSLGYHSAVQYLHDSVIPGQAEKVPGLEAYCVKFDYLDEQGLFTKVVLREFRDFGVSVEQRYPQPENVYEAKDFVDYVHDVASRQPGENLDAPGYKGAYISTAFVLIGDSDRMRREGPTLYTNYLRHLRRDGFARALLAARDSSIPMAETVSDLAEKSGLGKRTSSQKFRAKDTVDQVRDNIIIEMSLLPLGAHQPEQSRLFEE